MMTMFFKVIFWNAAKLSVWLLYDYMSLLRTLCCYQEHIGLLVGQCQLSCMPKMHSFLSRTPLAYSGYIKQFSAVECWHV